MTEDVARPTSDDDREGWKAYWAAQGMQWRKEPEIGEKQQAYLTKRRTTKPDIENGVYPFRDENGPIKLTRADVEWLLATHDSGSEVGPIIWEGQKKFGRRGLDLRGADLDGADLSKLPLAQIVAGAYGSPTSTLKRTISGLFFRRRKVAQYTSFATEEQTWTLTDPSLRPIPEAAAQMAGCNMRGAILAGATLVGANMQSSRLEAANLSQASLVSANMCRVFMDDQTALDGAILGNQRRDTYTAVSGARGFLLIILVTLRILGKILDILNTPFDIGPIIFFWLLTLGLLAGNIANAFSHTLAPMLLVFLGIALIFAALSTIVYLQDHPRYTQLGARLADIRWGNANLAVVDWQTIRATGDELLSRRRRDMSGVVKDWEARLAEYAAAERAYRQLVVAMRACGLNADADKYAYRAQLMRRSVTIRQFDVVGWFGSLLLDITSGYGFRPLRSVITYVVTVIFFAVLYWCVTNDVSLTHGLFTQALLALGMNPPSAPANHLQGYEAVVVSMTSFHGRGFFQPYTSPGDKVAILSAIEAAIGLLIEITFIATFTQRFFAR